MAQYEQNNEYDDYHEHDDHVDDRELETVLSFDEELQGLLGNKAKSALLVTRVVSHELLAALCQLADIAALCVGDEKGAVALLRNLDGNAPEAAAKDFTLVIAQLSVILVVNRADHLTARVYAQGKEEQEISPPLLLTTTPWFVEDILLGVISVDDLQSQGIACLDSAHLERSEVMDIVARYVSKPQ